jgi:hypothetical protein
VGRQVVCIADDWYSPYPVPTRLPMKNEVLTIDAIEARDGKCYLAFAEIPHEQRAEGWSAIITYAASCFRPVITLDDDMVAHFDHLLHLADFHPEPV